MDWTWGWSAVEAIASSILALGIIVVIKQVREAKKSTQAQIAMGLYTELRSEEAVKKLRSIYKLGAPIYWTSKS